VEFRDLLFFDKLIMPKVITFVYWLMLFGCIIGGLVTMFGSFISGLGILIGGVILSRLYCELMIVLFKMNESLAVIRNK
jgi:hypothetical protein